MDRLAFDVLYIMDVINRLLWPIFSMLIFIIVLIGSHPLDYRYDATFMHRVFVLLRKIILIVIPLMMGLIPLALYFVYAAVIDASRGSPDYIHWYWSMAKHNWRLALASFLSAFLLKIIHRRYLRPRWSDLKRKYRVKLTRDQLSDIREEKNKYQHKSFEPTYYYQDDQIFFGLDRDNKPIYVALSDWLETNMQIIGPTRFGKGILIGNQLDQAIRNGYGVFYIDPKGDSNIPHIMADCAKAIGRNFIYVDLNDEGVGGWHPFTGGDERAKRSRILMACGLEDTGNDSDFYKIGERGVLDKIMQTTTKINGMLQLFRAQKTKDYQESAKRLFGKLVEWEKVKSLSPKGEALSIAKSMLNNAVVYIKGSLDDTIVKDATRVLIVEIIQEARRLEKARQTHLTVVIDEVRFLMSNQVADASATITGTDTNLILAYQSKIDLRNVNDVNVDAKAVEASINTNCQFKFIYGTQDPETGKWAEEMSGKLQKLVTQREDMEVGHLGEERWEGHRMVSQKEEGFITLNTMLSLEKRAGVLYQPSKLPHIVFTSFVKTDRSHDFTHQHYLKSGKCSPEPTNKVLDSKPEMNPILTEAMKSNQRRGVSIDELG